VQKVEKDLTRFVFKKLGIPVVGAIPDEGRLEGGDFIAYSSDLCFIGVGLRTNMEAVKYLLERDLFGTKRVAVVVDEFDKCADRLHLDTVFCVLGDYVAAISKDVVG
jgi:arginine deiminase